MEVMWYGFDPELSKQLANIRQLVSRQHQTPTGEWPLIVDDTRSELLVVRAWPDGSLTAFTMPVPDTHS